jgi:hypothetical protein
VSCVGEQVVDQMISTYYGTANPASADSAVLKCQRSLGKNAAKFYATKRKALQKCQDGVLKSGSGSCPDSKATDKINKAWEAARRSPVTAPIGHAQGRPLADRWSSGGRRVRARPWQRCRIIG